MSQGDTYGGGRKTLVGGSRRAKVETEKRLQVAVETGSRGREELPDGWVTIATVIRETGREVFDVTSGQRTDDRRLGGGTKKHRKCRV